MGFDKQTLASVKHNTNFKFEKEIYMDKFMHGYQEVSDQEKDGNFIQSLNKKIQRLENILNNWENYGSESLKIESCLTNVIDFLEKQMNNDEFVDVEDFELNVHDLT